MEDFIVGLLAATLRVATPLIFATLGELFCERAGILNLGIEGTMFFGAFAGFTITSLTGSLWIGLIGAIIAGMFAGLLMSFFAVRLGCEPACFRVGDHPFVYSVVTFCISG